jgi:hypothetical protein
LSGEREGKPSASKLEAISLCRGFHLANYKFEWYGDRAAADEGTARHLHEEAETPLDDIDDDERRTCAYRARQAIEWCRDTIGIDGAVHRELRLWWDDKWSGQLDYTELDGDQAFIADYKMLRGVHDPAEINVQLMAQACLLVKNFEQCVGVHAALIEPFGDPRYTTASFTREFLLEQGKRLTSVVEEAMVEGAPRSASSKACKWCAAMPFCPEARNLLITTMGKFAI